MRKSAGVVGLGAAPNSLAYPNLRRSETFSEVAAQNDMLRRMRRSAIWFLIAVLWLVVAIVTALHRGWQQAWLQAVIAILFFVVAVYFRRKESVR